MHVQRPGGQRADSIRISQMLYSGWSMARERDRVPRIKRNQTIKVRHAIGGFWFHLEI